MGTRTRLGRGSRRGIAASLAVVAAASVLPILTGPTAVGITTSTWSWNLAPGVKLTRIRYSTPHEVRVLTITPSEGPRIDVSTGGSILAVTRRTSGQAVTVAGNSVAGVNGDFVSGPGFPMHALLVDGELWSSGGGAKGTALAVNVEGTRAWVGTPQLSMQLLGDGGTRLMQVSKWNAPRDTGAQVAGYTSRGGYVAQPDGVTNPTGNDPIWCSARLAPINALGWSGPERRAIVRSYRVKAQPEPCRKTPLSFGDYPDAVVLSARADSISGGKIRALTAGDKVKMSWAFIGWPGAVDVIGGNPQIVDDGVNIAPPYSSSDYLTGTHPRTSAGVNRGCVDGSLASVCKIFLVTVDGRQSATGWSQGMKLPQLAGELKKLRAWDAMNLDGGGSTTMWARRKRSGYCQNFPSVGGCLVNRPPGAERNVISGVAVLSGIDESTPTGLR